MKLLCIVLLALTAGSCTLGVRTRYIEVQFPDPAPWESAGIGQPWYLLVWSERSGEVQFLHVPSGTRSVFIEASKGYDIPMYAKAYGKYLGPGGSASAAETAAAVLLKDSLGEFAALLVELWEQFPEQCSRLNLRFWEETLLKEVALHDHGDIQLHGIDKQRLYMGIITGSFSSVKSWQLPRTQVTIPDLPKGMWYLKGRPAFQMLLDEARDADVVLPFPGSYVFVQANGDGHLHILNDIQGNASWILSGDRYGYQR